MLKGGVVCLLVYMEVIAHFGRHACVCVRALEKLHAAFCYGLYICVNTLTYTLTLYMCVNTLTYTLT